VRIRLSESHRFWLPVGLALIVLVVMLFGWVLPTRRSAAQAEREWALQVTLLNHLQSETDNLNVPSDATVKDRAAYRNWLDEQANLVDQYFAERAALLDGSITGEGEPTPERFKDAYIRVTKHQCAWLAGIKPRMEVPSIEGAFREYKWQKGTQFPRRDEFRAVLRDYWSRYYLYHSFLEAGVRKLHRMEIGKVRKISAQFDGIQFRASVSLPPRKIKDFVKKLLVVSSSVTSKPIFGLERLTVRADPERSRARLELAGYLLLQRKGEAGG